jgi:hypothetical protein
MCDISILIVEDFLRGSILCGHTMFQVASHLFLVYLVHMGMHQKLEKTRKTLDMLVDEDH